MGSRDIISSLPDEILGKILSLLPTKRAASTAVLSKRWNNLLALVDNLDFNDASGDPLWFPQFVYKTLSLLKDSITIKRISLNLTHIYEDHDVTTWNHTFLERGYLEVLYTDSPYMLITDTALFTSSTLVELTLCNGLIPVGLLPPMGVFFPKLKKLTLVQLGFVDCDTYMDLIPGCPVLEELTSHYDGHPPHWTKIVSPSIKRLTVFHHFPSYREAHNVCWFDTPSLVYLDYSSYVADLYDVVYLGSLVEARLNLLSWERCEGGDGGFDDDTEDDDTDDEDFKWTIKDELGDATNLVAGICNIKTLHLSPDSLEVLYFCCKPMPVFHNLLTLSFESDKERGWQVLPLLINNSPNLETLIIKGLVHQVKRKCGDFCACIPNRRRKKKKMEEGVYCLSTCHVKVLNVSAYGGTCRELKQMKHFLGNLKCLETVNVGVQVNHQEANDVTNTHLRIKDALMKLPTVSSNCRISFF